MSQTTTATTEEPKKCGGVKELEQILQRLEVRKTNLGLWNEEVPRPDRKALQVNYKKVAGFRKKVETLTAETASLVLDDIAKYNLSRFVEEAAIGLSQAKLDRKGDIPAAVKVACELHLRYEDFGNFLYDEIKKRFTELFIAPPPKVPLSAPDLKQRTLRQRTFVELMLELYMSGVIIDPRILLSALNRLVNKFHHICTHTHTH